MEFKTRQNWTIVLSIKMGLSLGCKGSNNWAGVWGGLWTLIILITWPGEVCSLCRNSLSCTLGKVLCVLFYMNNSVKYYWRKIGFSFSMSLYFLSYCLKGKTLIVLIYIELLTCVRHVSKGCIWINMFLYFNFGFGTLF